MMRSAGLLTLLIMIALCVSFTIQFLLMVNEEANRPEPPPGLAVDAAPQYSVGLFHFLSFALVAVVLSSRKYYWAFGIAASYFLLNIFATYSRLAVGFLGGDMCPEGHPCFGALRRASWFDLTSTVLLLLALTMITFIFLYQFRASNTLG